jgi:hypothetical protein
MNFKKDAMRIKYVCLIVAMIAISNCKTDKKEVNNSSNQKKPGVISVKNYDTAYFNNEFLLLRFEMFL